MKEALTAAQQMKCEVAFLTLTAGHTAKTKLSQARKDLGECYAKLQTSALWRRLKRDGLLGMCRTWETTGGVRSGWHLHPHAFLVVDPVAAKAAHEKAWAEFEARPETLAFRAKVQALAAEAEARHVEYEAALSEWMAKPRRRAEPPQMVQRRLARAESARMKAEVAAAKLEAMMPPLQPLTAVAAGEALIERWIFLLKERGWKVSRKAQDVRPIDLAQLNDADCELVEYGSKALRGWNIASEAAASWHKTGKRPDRLTIPEILAAAQQDPTWFGQNWASAKYAEAVEALKGQRLFMMGPGLKKALGIKSADLADGDAIEVEARPGRELGELTADLWGYAGILGMWAWVVTEVQTMAIEAGKPWREVDRRIRDEVRRRRQEVRLRPPGVRPRRWRHPKPASSPPSPPPP